MIGNDPIKSIRSIVRDMGESEFLIRHCMKTFGISHRRCYKDNFFYQM